MTELHQMLTKNNIGLINSNEGPMPDITGEKAVIHQQNIQLGLTISALMVNN